VVFDTDLGQLLALAPTWWKRGPIPVHGIVGRSNDMPAHFGHWPARWTASPTRRMAALPHFRAKGGMEPGELLYSLATGWWDGRRFDGCLPENRHSARPRRAADRPDRGSRASITPSPTTYSAHRIDVVRQRRSGLRQPRPTGPPALAALRVHAGAVPDSKASRRRRRPRHRLQGGDQRLARHPARPSAWWTKTAHPVSVYSSITPDC
jgi:hypothetical protein